MCKRDLTWQLCFSYGFDCYMHYFSQFDKCMYFYPNSTPPKETVMQKYNSQKEIIKTQCYLQNVFRILVLVNM